MKAMFKTQPTEQEKEAAALRLAQAVFGQDGPEPVDRAHPSFLVAMLALSLWDRMIADQLQPPLARRVRELRLGYVPPRAPPLFNRAWFLEIRRADADVRLFGDTVALGGFYAPVTDIWVLIGWRNDGGCGFQKLWPVNSRNSVRLGHAYLSCSGSSRC